MAMRSVDDGEGTTACTRRDAESRKIPVGSPCSSMSMLPPAGATVADVIAALRSATLFTQMQWPDVCVRTTG